MIFRRRRTLAAEVERWRSLRFRVLLDGGPIVDITLKSAELVALSAYVRNGERQPEPVTLNGLHELEIFLGELRIL